MKRPSFMPLSFRRRIQLLAAGKWIAFPLLPLVGYFSLRSGGRTALFSLVCPALFAAMAMWEASRRRQFIREARFPAFLGAKLREEYPQLSASDTDLALHGLRQFFLAHLRSNRKFVAMPSRLVDAAWHTFILHTRAYDQWCSSAFGKLMHHTPAEVLGRDPKRNDGLRRTWYWACKEESIDPRKPSRLPLLFALDKKFAIPGGFTYVPDCQDIDRRSGSDAYCGTSFGGGEASSGDAAGDGGDGGGCGGGCGGGD